MGSTLNKLVSLSSLALFSLLSTAPLLAQTPTAVVNGTVVDPTGAAVPDAKVRVVNQETNVATEKISGGNGTFTIINLLPGNYILTVEKSGFKKLALPVFKLDVNQTLTQQISLQVGAFHRNRHRQRRCRGRHDPALQHRIRHHHRRAGHA